MKEGAIVVCIYDFSSWLFRHPEVKVIPIKDEEYMVRQNVVINDVSALYLEGLVIGHAGGTEIGASTDAFVELLPPFNLEEAINTTTETNKQKKPQLEPEMA